MFNMLIGKIYPPLKKLRHGFLPNGYPFWGNNSYGVMIKRDVVGWFCNAIVVC